MEIREETRSSLNDRTHIIPALAILVPKSCREILRDLIANDHITPLDVAKMARIPERYADIVISEVFEEFVDTLRQMNGN